ncbi:unnamed protein product [Brassica oleracea var. botrytis]|uniref:Uncharacterized protein n=1 Tax=Brassica oleracea TaxID=3712 RepID=A0A3P6GMF3_BRAOL|nr:unnamed protein product [Brassica oleracea]
MEGSKKMMKRPIKEVYGSDASDGFNKGKAETVERYRALLRLSNEHRLSEIEWHQAAKQIALLPKSSCLKRLSRLKENLTSLLSWKNSKKNSWKRMECLLM